MLTHARISIQAPFRTSEGPHPINIQLSKPTHLSLKQRETIHSLTLFPPMTSNHPTNQTSQNIVTQNDSLPFTPLSAYPPCSSTAPAAAAANTAGEVAAAAAADEGPDYLASFSPTISYTSFPAYGTFKDPAATSAHFRLFSCCLGGRKPRAKLDLESAAEPLLGPKSQSESQSEPEPEAQPQWELKQKLGTVVGLIIMEGILTALIGTDRWIFRMFWFVVFVLYIFFSERVICWNGWMPRIKIR